MIVLDASAAVDLLLRLRSWASIEELVRDQEVLTTELLCPEVLHTLRRLNARGEMSDDRAALAVDDLLALPVETFPIRPLARRIWALRAAISAYDAAYVALAGGLGATLVTTDLRLASAARRHCRVAGPAG